jgi:hypothetical protein
MGSPSGVVKVIMAGSGADRDGVAPCHGSGMGAAAKKGVGRPEMRSDKAVADIPSAKLAA